VGNKPTLPSGKNCSRRGLVHWAGSVGCVAQVPKILNRSRVIRWKLALSLHHEETIFSSWKDTKMGLGKLSVGTPKNQKEKPPLESQQRTERYLLLFFGFVKKGQVVRGLSKSPSCHPTTKSYFSCFLESLSQDLRFTW